MKVFDYGHVDMEKQNRKIFGLQIRYKQHTVPSYNKHIFVSQKKRCAYYEESAYYGETCLFWEVKDFES